MGVQAGGIVSGPLAGAWSDRVGRKPVVLAGLVATSVTLAMLSVTSVTWLFIALVCVLGFAMFSVRPVIHSWTMDLTPKGMTGSAISLLFGTQSAFTMLVPVLGGVMADAYGLASVFYALTATVAIAAVLTSMVPPGRVAEAGA
jgi:MFS family permease